MKERAIVSGATLAISMLAYWYARKNNKDAAPYVMVGGFVGSLVGESIVEITQKDNKKIGRS